MTARHDRALTAYAEAREARAVCAADLDAARCARLLAGCRDLRIEDPSPYYAEALQAGAEAAREARNADEAAAEETFATMRAALLVRGLGSDVMHTGGNVWCLAVPVAGEMEGDIPTRQILIGDPDASGAWAAMAEDPRTGDPLIETLVPEHAPDDVEGFASAVVEAYARLRASAPRL